MNLKFFWYAPMFILLFHQSIKGQVNKNTDLYKKIISMDSLLFSVGFNQCNLQIFDDITTKNFKFYHDKSGATDKIAFLEDLKKGLCKPNSPYRSSRVLVPNSTEIFPLYYQNKLYAVIQKGKHRFYQTHQGKKRFASEARFTHLWILQQNHWKLQQVYSFDHLLPSELATIPPNFNTPNEVEAWLHQLNIPILGLGVIKKGQLQEVKIYGDHFSKQALPINTLFNVASLTKPITAILTLKLVEEGLWNLDEPLANFWIDPDIKNDVRHQKLTTRLVLSHQTGFPNWRYSHPDKKLTFTQDPGTVYQYSGEGFEYLRKALEAKFNTSLDQLVKKWIFNPLGMQDTYFYWKPQMESYSYATNYSVDKKTYPKAQNIKASAADDVITTLTDYGQFLTAILNQKIINPKTFSLVETPQVKIKPKKHFGLGFELYKIGEKDYVWSHGGSDQGVQTLFLIHPKTKSGLLLFTSVDEGYKVYEQCIKHYMGALGNQLFKIEMNR